MPASTVSTRLPRLCPCGILVPTASDETAIREPIFFMQAHTFFLFRPLLRTGLMDSEQLSTQSSTAHQEAEKRSVLRT